MSVLGNIKPENVFRFFEEICEIPHESYNEKAISDYCVDFAKKRNLEVIQDKLYNVIIKKPATKGYEDHVPVILQGHLDMVCEKDEDCILDMSKDPLQLYVEEGYVKAHKTTLGADDGIAVAYMLAILDAKDIEHPSIEAVFTVSEETGMEGASFIDLSSLKGKFLLNIDSEEEGEILTSCAGGIRKEINYSLELCENNYSNNYEIEIKGLLGGHSGCEIHKGLANSNILAGKILLDFLDKNIDYSLAGINGGNKDNAIPVNTKILIATDEKEENLKNILKEILLLTKKEYKITDPNIDFVLQKSDKAFDKIYSKKDLDVVVVLLNGLPNGVVSMSKDIPDMVETSLNLGIVSTKEDCFKMTYLIRSSLNSAADYLSKKIAFIANFAGATSADINSYPAWEFNNTSKLQKLATEIYEKMFDKKATLKAIHAGVECGLLSAKIDGLDCISIGPDILDIHTPRERLDIKSVERVYDYILEILKNL